MTEFGSPGTDAAKEAPGKARRRVGEQVLNDLAAALWPWFWTTVSVDVPTFAIERALELWTAAPQPRSVASPLALPSTPRLVAAHTEPRWS